MRADRFATWRISGHWAASPHEPVRLVEIIPSDMAIGRSTWTSSPSRCAGGLLSQLADREMAADTEQAATSLFDTNRGQESERGSSMLAQPDRDGSGRERACVCVVGLTGGPRRA